MGAAIECFPGSSAIVVSKSRFAPVKKCSDLLLLRSDAYVINAEFVLVLSDKCRGVAPIVNLDDKKYKLVQNMEAAFSNGYPSLVNCTRLTVKGMVYMSRGNIFQGDVTIINNHKDPKVLPPGIYPDGAVIDLTDAPGLGPLLVSSLVTTPYLDQKPGTSGLRKKTRHFQKQNYLHNFVQSTFNALMETNPDLDLSKGSMLVGGDGRYYNDEAIQIIIKIAVANGVKRLLIGQNGLLSTPAVSTIIRERGPVWEKCFGAFILTASHNPGGIEEDFGIKYNCENGGPAVESLTNAIFEESKTVSTIKMCESFPVIDISQVGSHVVSSGDGSMRAVVQVISATQAHVDIMKSIFDFPKLKEFVSRPDFQMLYDCMHGVQGPYAHEIFVTELGLPSSCLLNAIPLPDFNGHHADPNLTYARDICDLMHVDKKGDVMQVEPGKERDIPAFGAVVDYFISSLS